MKAGVLYLCLFGFFVVLGWTFRQELRTAQQIQVTIGKQAQAMQASVEALNARVLRYETEYERRFLLSQQKMTEVLDTVMTSEERGRLDLLRRVQTLEAHDK